jgi:hypothetical protein
MRAALLIALLLLTSCQRALPQDIAVIVNNEVLDTRVLHSDTYLSGIDCINESRTVVCSEVEMEEKAIDRMLLLQDMDKNNVSIDVSVVDAEYVAVVSSLGTSFPQLLAAENITEEEFRDALYDTYKVDQYKQILSINTLNPEDAVNAHIQRLRAQATIRR